MEHLTAKLGIGCLERNIDWPQMVLYDTVDIVITHICKCYIITLQKRKAGIIVFKIQSFPHPRRHLIDKTENTVVSAGTIFIHQSIIELDPQIFLIIFFNLQFPFFPVGLTDQYCQIIIVYQIMIIENIFDLLVIDGNQFISRFDLQFFGYTPGLNHLYNMFVFFHSTFSVLLVRTIITIPPEIFREVF